MRNSIVLAVFVICLVVVGQGARIVNTGDCPPNEYNPGPDCYTEPTCAPRSSHFYPKHTCDCWCKPGLYRNIDTNECVSKC